MTSFITKAAVAALVALGAIGATTQANAAQVDVIVRTPHVVRKPVVIVRPPVVVRKPVVIVKPAPVVVIKPAGRCAPALAVQKAASRGLNRASVSFVGPNRVVVSGKIRGVWTKMTFANVRGCPRL